MQANTEITLKAQTPTQGSEQHPEVHIVTQHLSASFWLGSALIYVCRTGVHVQILLPVLTVSDTHKNGSDFHLTPLLFFFILLACCKPDLLIISSMLLSLSQLPPSLLLAKTTGSSCRTPVFSKRPLHSFCPQTHYQANGQALLGRITHGDVFKMNVSDVVVGAALPGVVEPEGQGTRVPAVQGSKFAEGAVLDIDWAIVELNPSNGKIPETHWKETEKHGHDIHRHELENVFWARTVLQHLILSCCLFSQP